MSPSPPVRVALLTVSDTRVARDDESGRLLRELLEGDGCTVLEQKIVPDEIDAIRAFVLDTCARLSPDWIVTTGGTGIAARDVTIEALEPLFDKRLDGFGEAFRRLSWEQVGARSVLSRAIAGAHGSTCVAALPGSKKAVRLAVEELILPLARHTRALLAGDTRHEPPDPPPPARE